MSRLLLLMIPVALLTGCARYEFDVVEPKSLARHVADRWETARWGPIDYGLRAAENRLVIEVHNTTAGEMRIIGERSYIVGPTGQSHPLAGQTIAPMSFVKLILPPMPRVMYRSGPDIGLGFGIGFGSAHGHHGGRSSFGGGFYDPWCFDEPRYVAVYDGPDSAYWDWPGEGDARLHLVIQPAGPDSPTPLVHDFTFRRKKM